MISLAKRFCAATGRRWNERPWYKSTFHWILSLYNRVLNRLPGLPLPGRHQVCRIYLKGIEYPFYLRLGTTDWLVLEEIFKKGEYLPALRGESEPVKLILDLGSNVGYSVRFWKDHFPDAQIVAVEPDSGNASLFEMNVAPIQDQSRPRLIQACVAGSSRQVSLSREGGEWAYKMVEMEDPASKSISALSVNDILQLVGAECIDILKCDIEGAELEVFKKCSTWIGNVKKLIVELHQPYSEAEFFNDLRSNGATFNLISRVKDASRPVLFLERAA